MNGKKVIEEALGMLDVDDVLYITADGKTTEVVKDEFRMNAGGEYSMRSMTVGDDVQFGESEKFNIDLFINISNVSVYLFESDEDKILFDSK